MPDYPVIYAEAAKEILAGKPMRCDEPDVSLTLHPDKDAYYAVAMNYIAEERDAKVILKDGWKLEPIYGDFKAVEPCGLAVARLVRE